MALDVRQETQTMPRLEGAPFYLHIGMPKTATTLLQRHFFPAHPALEYLGKYPNRAVDDPIHECLEFLRTPDPQATQPIKYLQQRAKEARTHNRIPIVSLENLFRNNRSEGESQARTLHSLFADLRIVLVIRHPLRFLESLYFEGLRAYNLGSRPNFERNFGPPPRLYSIEDWLQTHNPGTSVLVRDIVEPWLYTLGKQHVRILVFEQLLAEPQEFAEELCAFLGVDSQLCKEILAQQRRNDRWTAEHIRQIRRIERSAWLKWRYRRLDRKQRIQFLEKLVVEQNSNKNSKASVTIPDSWKTKILELSKHDYKWLADQFSLDLQQYGYPLHDPNRKKRGKGEVET